MMPKYILDHYWTSRKLCLRSLMVEEVLCGEDVRPPVVDMLRLIGVVIEVLRGF